jgi:hypothetical protein
VKKNNCVNGRTLRFVAGFGSIGFISCYITAAFYYPGGSDFNVHSGHFSLMENYWCELLSDYAKNGQLNPGRPFALGSLFFLNTILISSWFQISLNGTKNGTINFPLILSGISSTLLINFVSGENHDIYIVFSVGMGMMAILQVIYAEWHKNKLLFFTGLIGFLLISLNCIFYFFDLILVFLPILQKITFIYMLIWFLMNLTDKKTYESNQ